MGLLDYYRQFKDIDPETVNRGLRERRRREQQASHARVGTIDLSSTEWPAFPSYKVVDAAIARARKSLNTYPDPDASAVRSLLAERHRVEPEQIIFGNGAGELLRSAALALLSPGDQLVTSWPSYGLYPAIAEAAQGRLVRVPSSGGEDDVPALLAAVGDKTRALVVCRPNDPTGGFLDARGVEQLLAGLSDRVHVLLDEALIQFQDVEEEDAALRLVERFPNLLVIRSFSKIYGLAALRAGYAVGARTASSLLRTLRPPGGVNTLTQAAIGAALQAVEGEVRHRAEAVREQRRQLARALPELGAEMAESHGNFIWFRMPGIGGAELAARLERARVLVARGGPLGDERYVRASIMSPAAAERLIAALRGLA